MGTDTVFQKMGKSFVKGTNDREACPKRWIGVLVQINTEKKVAQRLQKLGYECYVPTQFEIHQWSDRKKRIERVVIPMVVFILIGKSQEKNNSRFLFHI